MKRIRRLLYPQSPNGALTPLFSAVILLATAAVALTAWQAAPPHQRSGTAQEQTARAVKSPYDMWLNEDVSYIIDDKERAVFQNLTTDEEREKFIEQFWLRRDPTPGTVENEFKQEHYRRIVDATQHFRAPSGRSGWRTDRGHMYILYGPPDEIESHPSGTQTSYPFEDWKYWHVEGVGDNLFFKFIDRMRTGDYRLAPGNAR